MHGDGKSMAEVWQKCFFGQGHPRLGSWGLEFWIGEQTLYGSRVLRIRLCVGVLGVGF